MSALSVLQVGPKNKSTFVPMVATVKPKTAWDSYMAGQQKYLAGTGTDACKGADELKGWQDALKFDADYQTAVWLGEHGGAEDDAEWIRRGC